VLPGAILPNILSVLNEKTSNGLVAAFIYDNFLSSFTCTLHFPCYTEYIMERHVMDMIDNHNSSESLGGSEEKVSVSWLISQQLTDLKGQIAEVKNDLSQLKQSTENRFNAMERRLNGMNRQWMWSMGLLLLMVLGLLVKLLIPSA
jgi:hypothetical protein